MDASANAKCHPIPTHVTVELGSAQCESQRDSPSSGEATVLSRNVQLQGPIATSLSGRSKITVSMFLNDMLFCIPTPPMEVRSTQDEDRDEIKMQSSSESDASMNDSNTLTLDDEKTDNESKKRYPETVYFSVDGTLLTVPPEPLLLSPYFSALTQGPGKQSDAHNQGSESDPIVLEDCSADAFKTVVDFLSSDHQELPYVPTKKLLKELLAASEKWMLPRRFSALCQQEILKSFSVTRETVELLLFAKQYHIHPLFDICKEMLLQQREGWEHFVPRKVQDDSTTMAILAAELAT